MHLLADISTGNTGFADVMFLLGVVLAVLAALAAAAVHVTDPSRPDPARWSPLLGWLAVAALALGWLVL